MLRATVTAALVALGLSVGAQSAFAQNWYDWLPRSARGFRNGGLHVDIRPSYDNRPHWRDRDERSYRDYRSNRYNYDRSRSYPTDYQDGRDYYQGGRDYYQGGRDFRGGRDFQVQIRQPNWKTESFNDEYQMRDFVESKRRNNWDVQVQQGEYGGYDVHYRLPNWAGTRYGVADSMGEARRQQEQMQHEGYETRIVPR